MPIGKRNSSQLPDRPQRYGVSIRKKTKNQPTYISLFQDITDFYNILSVFYQIPLVATVCAW